MLRRLELQKKQQLGVSEDSPILRTSLHMETPEDLRMEHEPLPQLPHLPMINVAFSNNDTTTKRRNVSYKLSETTSPTSSTVHRIVATHQRLGPNKESPLKDRLQEQTHTI